MRIFNKIITIAFIFAALSLTANAALNGTYTVGSGGNYSTLKSAFDAINSQGCSGNVTLNIISNITESSTAQLNTRSVGANYTITIQPSGGAREIRGSFYHNGTIRLYGADNVTISGLIDGSGAGQNLTIRNTYSSTYTFAIWLSSPSSGNGCENIKINNCKLYAYSYSSSYNIPIFIGGSSYSSMGYNHRKITIKDNLLDNAYYGIRAYCSSTSSSYRYENIEISGNEIGNSSRPAYYALYMYRVYDNFKYHDNKIYARGYGMYCYYNLNGDIYDNDITMTAGSYGLYCYYSDNNDIYNNKITATGNVSYGMRVYYSDNNNFKNNVVDGFYGYGFYVYGSNYNEFTENEYKGARYSTSYMRGFYLSNSDYNDFYGNKIHDLENTSSSGAVYGFELNGADYNVFVNNQIYDFTNTGSSSSYYYSITAWRMSSGSYNKFYNNSVYFNNKLSGTGAGISSCMMITTSSNLYMDLRNNIFVNKTTHNGSGKSYIFYCYYTGSHFSQIDYNDYYYSDAKNGYLAYAGGDKSDLTAWQGYSKQDENSVTESVVFKGNDDLHLDGSSVTNDKLMCKTISDAKTDIDGETRRTPESFMGVDEVVFNIGFPTTDDDLTMFTKPFCVGDEATLSVNPAIVSYNDGVSRVVKPDFNYTWYANGTDVNYLGDSRYTVTDNELILSDLNIDDNETTFSVLIELGTQSLTSQRSTIDVEAPLMKVQDPVGDNVCETVETYSLTCQFDGTLDSYQWQIEDPNQPGTFYNISGEINDHLDVDVTQFVGETRTYRVIAYGPGNCGPASLTSQPASITVYENVSDAVAICSEEDGARLCEGGEVRFWCTAKGSISGYQWQRSDDGVYFYDVDKRRFPTADKSELLIPSTSIDETGYYKCLVFGNAYCAGTAVESNVIYINVSRKFAFFEEPESKVLCFGESTELFVVGDGDVSAYRWELDGEFLDTEIYPSADEAMLYLDNLTYKESGLYTCVLSVEDCLGEREVRSAGALIYVVTAPEITRNPESVEANEGETAVFEVQAHVRNLPDEENQRRLKYQWYKGGTALEDNDRFFGTDESILSVVNLQAGDFGDDYYVIVTGQCGETQSADFSIVAKPGIDVQTQPEDVTLCEGATATLTFTAEPTNGGTDLTYQWMKDGMPLTDDPPHIVGVMTNTLTIMTEVADGGNYNCEITVLPSGATEMTDMAVVNVQTTPVIVSTLAEPDSLKMHQDEVFTLTVTEVSGVGPFTYQWRKDSVDIPGATENVYSKAAEDVDAGIYNCLVSNLCGGTLSDNFIVEVQKENSVGVSESVSGGFILYGNIPNPANEKTIIRFHVPGTATVKLLITDIYGRETTEITNKAYAKGDHEILLNLSNYNLSSGIYNYTLISGDHIITKRMVVVK